MTTTHYDLLFLIPLFPLLGALFNGIMSIRAARSGSQPSRKLVNGIACLMPALSFAIVGLAYFKLRSVDALSQSLFTWMEVGNFKVDAAFLFDHLSCLYLGFITFVGTLIHIYSIGYMAHDKGFARYMAYLNLFMFSMILLVLGSSLPLMFVGWEGVGLCSYLLIGFWFSDEAKASAGKKAFIVNRIGDFGFVLGMGLIFVHFHGLLDYVGLMNDVSARHGAVADAGIVTAACLLLFLGCCGKSAQLPLYVWLPDAMAGPTPVSALIHAATMVTAGVYLVARMGFLFVLSPTALAVVATVGALTALFAALIGFLQYDIKKVLAYSTVSQLGFMFLGVGVGAFSAGIFHVVTHAFFKACLFLGAGSVIHAMHEEQDIRKMGGLHKAMPWTSWTFHICWLAIIGCPLFSGFFSKDEILWQTFISTAINPRLAKVLWGIAFVAAGCTAYYMTRLVILTFWGQCRADKETRESIHESPRSMTVPLCILAVGAVVIGYFGLPHVVIHQDSLITTWLHHTFDQTGQEANHGSASLEWMLMGLSVLIAAIGSTIAIYFYWLKPRLPETLLPRFQPIYSLIHNKFYVDEIYDFAFVRSTYRFSRDVLFKFCDVVVIEGIVNGTARVAHKLGETLRPLHSGDTRTYARWITVGTLFTLLLIGFGAL
jgi:NADH-quinone oxidoreductase subunit L